MGAGAFAAIVVVVAIVSSVGPGDSVLPDEVLGLPRVENQDVRVLQDAMSEFRFGDLEIELTAYGAGDDVAVVLFRHSGGPMDLEGMVKGAGGGIIGSGGQAGLDRITRHEVEGVDYRCLPFRGQLFATSETVSEGFACGWLEGEDSALVMMDTLATDAASAAGNAVAVHDALTT